MARQVTIEGLDEVLGNLANVNRTLARRGLVAMRVEGEKVMLKAKRLTPVDTGVLEGSGRVSPPVETGGVFSVTLSFGGPAKDYAIPVHERLDVRHTNGQAKFLQQPVMEHAAVFAASVASTLRAMMNGA